MTQPTQTTQPIQIRNQLFNQMFPAPFKPKEISLISHMICRFWSMYGTDGTMHRNKLPNQDSISSPIHPGQTYPT